MNEDYQYGFEDGRADAERGTQETDPTWSTEYRRGYDAGVESADSPD